MTSEIYANARFKRLPSTEDEERLLKLIYRIHAGCNLQGFLIDSDEVLRKVQEMINEERQHWESNPGG